MVARLEDLPKAIGESELTALFQCDNLAFHDGMRLRIKRSKRQRKAKRRATRAAKKARKRGQV